MTTIIEKLIGEKQRWRQFKKRTKALPPSYGEAVEAITRYLMFFGPTDGDAAATMLEDLVELFEQAAADGTPIRGIVGDDPVEFVDTFARNYKQGGWVTREQDRLTSAIDRAAG